MCVEELVKNSQTGFTRVAQMHHFAGFVPACLRSYPADWRTLRVLRVLKNPARREPEQQEGLNTGLFSLFS